jgi:hypothetical protein
VHEACGIALEWEIERIGRPLAGIEPIAAGAAKP